MKNTANLGLLLLTLFLFACQSNQKPTNPTMKSTLLVNHTGYQTTNSKKVVLQTNSELTPTSFEIINENNDVVFEGAFNEGGKIDNWHTGSAFAGDFSDLKTPGTYRVKTQFSGTDITSRAFEIHTTSLSETSLALLLTGMESQHCAGDFNEKDKSMSFFGERSDVLDVSGGWYDASGDRGKYLSHLCYSNYFNPQQTPLIVWSLLKGAVHYNETSDNSELHQRMLNEAVFGADFLMRMQDKEGYFYTNVFANWSWDPAKREICAYEGIEGIKTEDYKAGFREGAGLAIAALAKASTDTKGGDYTSESYLSAAENGFQHLLQHNIEYIDDGVENILDDYCALMASTELYIATGKEAYLNYSQKRAKTLNERISNDANYKGWWSANDAKNRPFFHGVEAGLPIIALTNYLAIETNEDYRNSTIQTIQSSVDFEIAITNEVHNPFGYPRQYVKATDESEFRTSFFIPHQNETNYWWQGENSRIASLITAFNIAEKYMSETQKNAAKTYNTDCFNWIFGLNPYDMSMVEGIGYNNPDYSEGGNLNFEGGVCNGITAGFDDESDIAFMPAPQNEDPGNKWRWAEQWMPHAAWLVLAVTTTN